MGRLAWETLNPAPWKFLEIGCERNEVQKTSRTCLLQSRGSTSRGKAMRGAGCTWQMSKRSRPRDETHDGCLLHGLSALLIPKVPSLSSLVLPAGKEDVFGASWEHCVRCSAAWLLPKRPETVDFYLCSPQYEQWVGLYLPALVYEACRTLKVWEVCPSGQEEFVSSVRSRGKKGNDSR